jgi:alkylation response protein AidB-like acyl-CoA dehydrogenase
MEAQQCLVSLHHHETWGKLMKKGGNDYSAGRLLRDSRLYTVGAGTQEIRRMLIGRGFNEQFAAVDGRVVAQ